MGISEGLRIVQFTAENVKRLKLVRITPKGHVIPITGKNGQGKTSVLDAIWWALGGKENISSVPIRKGSEQAVITLDLGDFIVERVFTSKRKCSLCGGTGHLDQGSIIADCTACSGVGYFAENGTTLTVRAPSAVAGKKGPKYDSPQAMLDALVGSLSFDPLEFSRASAAEQFSILRKTVNVNFDFEGSAKENDADYKERTQVNQLAKSKRALANSMEVAEELPEDPIDEDRLQQEMRKAYDANSDRAIQELERQIQVNKLDDLALRIPQLRAEADEMRKKAAELDREAENLTTAIAESRKILADLPPLPDVVDIDAIANAINNAKRINSEIKKREIRDTAIAEAVQAEARSKELSAAMEQRQKAKRDIVASTAMPVPNLGFGDGYVTLNGLPFEQASDAERLRVSLAIAMATNPKLRVIRVRDGSLLDEDSIKLIAEMAEAGDYQVWMERVDTSGKIGIVLEDGEVKADNQVETEGADGNTKDRAN